jgi:hypothetical protein
MKKSALLVRPIHDGGSNMCNISEQSKEKEAVGGTRDGRRCQIQGQKTASGHTGTDKGQRSSKEKVDAIKKSSLWHVLIDLGNRQGQPLSSQSGRDVSLVSSVGR